MPRVSIIIPTYNRGPLLCETLDSAFAQSYRDFEIVVVDDGSTDDTGEQLREYGTRIRVEQISHAGVSAARNVGLDRAQGELVAFLDSDDLWDAHFLERMTRALMLAPEADFAYCDYELFDERGPLGGAYLPAWHKLEGDLFGALLESDFLCVGTVLIRRGACQELRFDLGLAVAEDWDFWLRLARTGKAAYVNAPLVRVRVNPTAASGDPGLLYPSNLKVLDKLERDFPEEARQFRPLIRVQRSRFHRALAKYYGSQRRPLPALRQMALATATRFL